MRALVLATLLHAATAGTRVRDDYALRADHDHDSVERVHQVRPPPRRTRRGRRRARNKPSPRSAGAARAPGSGSRGSAIHNAPLHSPLPRAWSHSIRHRAQMKPYVGDADEQNFVHKVRPPSARPPLG